jgi:HSP20 family protein
MPITKWRNPDDVFPSFSSIFDDFMPGGLRNGNVRLYNEPAVNISEDDDNFEVEVAAPGLKKEDFTVDLDHNLITISAEKKEEKEETDDKKVTRREFSYSSFKRSFNLPETVEANDIKASYSDGVLKLNLPKKEESKKQPPKRIEIS